MGSKTSFDVLPCDVRTDLGESPWWHLGWFSWIDIPQRQIYRCRLDGADLTSITTPTWVGFALPTSSGQWLAGLTDGVWVGETEAGGWTNLWTASHDSLTHRVNDGKTDPAGRVWFGSMSYAEMDPSATLYCLRGSEVTIERSGVITSNGIGWSPDGLTMYHTDSICRVIRAYDYDPASAAISGERVFATDPIGYVPDGMTVDSSGCVWSAKWDGGKVVRYTPDGRVDREISTPVMRPTSCTFVGPRLDTLAITTAVPLDPALASEFDGAVLLVEAGVAGLPLQPADVGWTA